MAHNSTSRTVRARSPSSSRSPASMSRIEQVLNISPEVTSSPRSARPIPFAQRTSQLDDLLGAMSSGNSNTEHSPSTLSARPPSLPGLSLSVGARSTSMPFHPASVPSSSSSMHPTPRVASTSFVPRIVRGIESNGGTAGNSSAQPLRPTIPPQHSRTRRSTSILSLARSPPASRGTPAPVTPNSQVSLPSPPSSFPRPSYLNHSSLRDLLCSESVPSLPPNKYRFDGMSNEHALSSEYKRSLHTLTAATNTDSEDESVLVGDAREPRLSTPAVNAVTHLKLPTRWNVNDRNSNLSVSSNGTELVFNGPPTNGDRDAAAGRTNFSIPPACGIYYFEVEIINKGTKGHISIGVSAPDVRLNRLPGWEGLSWGYHGDDGNVFSMECQGRTYGPTYTSGDVIGCGIDFSIRRMFYTKNGAFLSLVFDNVGTNCQLYPSVGLRSPGESVRANFGQEAFQFDIDSYVQQERTRVWRAIQSTPLQVSADPLLGSLGLVSGVDLQVLNSMTSTFPPSEPRRDVINCIDDLVLSYLTHHGYSNTARAMRQHRDRHLPIVINTMPPPSTVEDMELDTDADDAIAANAVLSSQQEEEELDTRLRIVRAVKSGDIDNALTQTQRHYPRVLEVEDGLMNFKLRCRKFVELLLDAAELLRKARRESGESTHGPEQTASDREVEEDKARMTDGVFEMDMDMTEASGTVTMNGSTAGTTVNGHGTELSPSHKGKKRQTIPPPPFLPSSVRGEEYQVAVSKALSYGQTLQTEYADDERPTMQDLFSKTFSLIAYDDPLGVGGEPAAFAGQQARNALAAELNRAILASKGEATEPALERVYRQASGCIRELGIVGVGAAAFADIRKEFLET